MSDFVHKLGGRFDEVMLTFRRVRVIVSDDPVVSLKARSDVALYPSDINRKRFILLLKQRAPVDIGKEVVRLGSCGIVGTKTTLVIEIKQVHQKIPSNSITAREGQRLLQDLAVHFVDVLIVEWRQTRQHLVEPDTKSPLIHGFWGQGVPEYHSRLVQVSDRSSVKCAVRMVDQQRE